MVKDFEKFEDPILELKYWMKVKLLHYAVAQCDGWFGLGG